MAKLNFKKIDSISTKKKICDGNGLWIYISSKTSKSWVFIWTKDKKRNEMGLGSFPEIPLQEARNLAHKAKQFVLHGKNPRKELKRPSSGIDFQKAATSRYDEIKDKFKNHTHREQWITSLENHAFPIIGNRLVSELDHNDVYDVLSKIWLSKRETARRIRQRIIDIVDWSIYQGYRNTPFLTSIVDNRLKTLKGKITPKKHFAALEYNLVPDFFKSLSEHSSVTSLALRFLILTGARTIEVRKAQWPQIDEEKSVWIKPEEIMKMDKEHHVPLSPEALELLKLAKPLNSKKNSTIIFQGTSKIVEQNLNTDKKVVISNLLSEGTMMKLAKNIAGNSNITVHGFRSTFRDWARENEIKDDVAELCLAHENKNLVERAYKRTQLLEERKSCLKKWAEFCYSKI